MLRYSKTTMERFMNPKHVGEMKDFDGFGEEGNFKCGDVMDIYIKVKDDIITDISFLTYGCVAAIASTDMLCDVAKGMHIDEAEKLNAKKVIDALEDVPAVKTHCSIMGLLALKRAIIDYKNKRDGVKPKLEVVSVEETTHTNLVSPKQDAPIINKNFKSETKD